MRPKPPRAQTRGWPDAHHVVVEPPDPGRVTAAGFGVQEPHHALGIEERLGRTLGDAEFGPRYEPVQFQLGLVAKVLVLRVGAGAGPIGVATLAVGPGR